MVNDDSNEKTSALLRNCAVILTTIVLLALIYCLGEALTTGFEHVARTVYIWDREQTSKFGLFGLMIGYCIWLTIIVSKIEKLGVSWTDASNSHVKDAQKCVVLIALISGLLLYTSCFSPISVAGLAIVILFFGLRAVFCLNLFRLKPGFSLFAKTLLYSMAMLSIIWMVFAH
ncbi:MAG: hypothetical protein C0469_18315 [Cyanobacteria bacterium DS2.3.42]|nr:hypothetical protein [Cyanobacteria bacterium DS2.3.42]